MQSRFNLERLYVLHLDECVIGKRQNDPVTYLSIYGSPEGIIIESRVFVTNNIITRIRLISGNTHFALLSNRRLLRQSRQTAH